MIRCLYVMLLTAVLITLALPVYSANRVALVIGNGDYASAPLKNPVNDATDMASLLEQLDFNVIQETNASKKQMVAAVNRFSRELKKSEVGLFYFAGHGMQIDNRNYLIPVGVNVVEESDVEFEAVDASRIIAKMKNADNRLNIVVLDACRNNPFARSFRTAEQGLARMDAPKGTIIAYATSPGSVAADGKGRNGIYTKHLLQALKMPGLDIQDIFNEAGMGVMGDTNDLQIPWTSNTPIPRFYLAGGDSPATVSDVGSGYSLSPQTGNLKITSTPSGALIGINGTQVGKTPLSLKEQQPGTLMISVSLNNYVDQQRTVTITANRRTVIDFDLKQERRTGWLTVVTDPADARVRILNISPTYEPGMALVAGRYRVEVSAPGYITETKSVELAAGDDLRTSVTLVREKQQPGRVSPPSALTTKSSPSLAAAPRSYTDPITGMEFVRVRGGCYPMGCESNTNTASVPFVPSLAELPMWQWPLAAIAAVLPVGCARPVNRSPYEPKSFYDLTVCFDDEQPVHEVCVDDFYIGKYEVTQGQYEKIIGTNPSMRKKGSSYPVEKVSWNDALSFIRKLNRASDRKYRLPTEAEWEYAARSGGNKEKFAGGSNLEKVAWYDGNSVSTIHPVGRKQANGLGIYDMSGNVWEWTGDYYDDDYYKSSPRTNPTGPSSGVSRVIRGGGWINTPGYVRTVIRGGNVPEARNSSLGFRLVSPVRR